MPNSKLRKIIRWSVLTLILVIFGVWLVPRFMGATDTSPESAKGSAGANARGGRMVPVTIHVAAKESVMDGIKSVGSMVANEEVDLASEISGKVSRVCFTEGQEVRKGDVMIEINDDDLQAQLQKLFFQQKTLADKLERQKILFQQEAVSRESYDMVQTEYNMLQADIDLVKIKIDRSRIKAPFSGNVGFRYVSEGSYIQPNSRIARMVDYSKLKVEFSIPEKYNNMPLIGKRVYFTTESEKTPQAALVAALEPKVDEITRTIVIRAHYNNVGKKFRPGMSCTITVPTAEAQEILMVPTQAIVPTMDGQSVWLATGGEAVQRPVTTGFRTEKQIQITRGLEPGDSVIISGIMQMRDGVKISVH